MDYNYWFPWYPARFKADTMHLDCNEDGAYRRLIDHYMETRLPLPNNPIALARITGKSVTEWQETSARIMAFFSEKDGKLYNKKCDEILEEQNGRSKGKKMTGNTGANARWKKEATKETRSKRLQNARMKGTHTAEEWKILQEVCGNTCVKCGTSKHDLFGELLCKDHVMPIYQGGSDAIDNIQPMCRNCNSRKGPENNDYRPIDWKKRLQNACKTPANVWHNTEHNIIEQNSKKEEKIKTKKEILYSPEFETFWKAYPPNGATKSKTAERYNQAIKGGTDHGRIMESLAKFKNYLERSGISAAYATTWLNEQRWTIDYDAIGGQPTMLGTTSRGKPSVGDMAREASAIVRGERPSNRGLGESGVDEFSSIRG